MRTNERVGVAVLAATVGAAVGTAITGRGWRPRQPGRPQLALLPASSPRDLVLVAQPEDIAAPAEETIEEIAVVDDADTAEDEVDAVEDDAVEEDAAAVDVATPEGPRTIAVSSIANAVSFMAIGGLVVVLVLWATGGFAAEAGTTALAAATRAPLPVTTAPEVVATAPPVAGDDSAAEDVAAGAEPVQAAPPPIQVPDPQRIEIPAVGVDATVIPLGVEENGALQVPEDFAQTGWWTGGPEPGEQGASVIVGHVDSFQGPAVFFGLRDLAYDDTVTVTRGDGSSAVFAVRSAVAVDKDAFPTDLVYGPTDETILRLITCDGDFTDGSYLGNLIVTAVLVEERPAPDAGVTY